LKKDTAGGRPAIRGATARRARADVAQVAPGRHEDLVRPKKAEPDGTKCHRP